MGRYDATDRAVSDTPSDFQGYMVSFQRHLRAAGKADRTVQTYTESLTQFARFLANHGMPTDPTRVKRSHAESFIADLLTRYKPATAHNRYRALAAFFRWLVEDDEIRESPMTRMKPPAIPESPPAVLSESDLSRLLKICAGSSFEDRRDTAFIRPRTGTGRRRPARTGSGTGTRTLRTGQGGGGPCPDGPGTSGECV